MGSKKVDASITVESANTSVTSTRARLWKRLEEQWNKIQVGHQGAYSVERLESFDYYCKTTSRTRVILVCLLTPVPALSTAIALECLPLQSPSGGWTANWVFWIRLTLTTCIMGISTLASLVTLVPDINPTFLKRQLVAWGMSAAYVTTALIAAISIGFPIPLMWYIGGFPAGIQAQVMMFLVFGRKPFLRTSPCRPNLLRFARYLGSFMMLASIYPLYKVLYGFVPVQYRGIVVVLVLPIWRLSAKQFMVQFSREFEDFMPGVIATSVDFFSALFVSVCMSTSQSLYLSMLFIAADIGESLLEFWDMRINANTVLKLLHDRHASTERFKAKDKPFSAYSNTSLVELILAVTRDPHAFHITAFKGVRLRACYPHQMSAEQVRTLHVLNGSGIYGCTTSSLGIQPHQSTLSRKIHVATSNLVVTSTPEVDTTIQTKDEKQDDDASNNTRKHYRAIAARSESLVQQGLQLLFHCEYLVLVEYVECVVPLVFLTYKTVLKNLPNAVYYPAGTDQWGDGTVVNILVFASLEIVSLLLVHFSLKIKFSFSPLYQLAFVLETEVYLVQHKLFIGTLFLLQYELEHLGADFTFQFKWLHDS
ncbi:Hypothetical protein PHPALM_37624 [Phytophthora palmivora]|uniref:Transmembrane protein n=1 Tax=Phytophthora palmivora TaxID=4796 RepID=A0A2P4WWZ6_9STRA|nr:Hypothetical protein PHPALM_37624 [Phytophthora palmivora]